MEPRNQIQLRIGDVLLEMGYARKEQIDEALAYQKDHPGIRMGDALVSLGIISEQQMLEALASRLHYPVVDLADLPVDVEAVGRIPQVLAEKYCMMGYRMTEDTYGLLVNDPMNFYGIEDIRQIVGMGLEIALCERSSLENAIHFYYSEVSAKEAADRAARNAAPVEAENIHVEYAGDDTPIVNLLNSLITRAFNSNVSDIHVEPGEKETRVRMRLDGVITDFMTLQKNIHQSLIARIKILGDMDIAERRIPQDGHFYVNMGGEHLNIRVSVIPTVFGEKAVLRLLSGAAVIDHAGTYGMNEFHYRQMKKMLQSPNGMIYVTGPTGSGKSTTLYMMLAELSERSVNISTIEDPVEKFLPRLNQMQVNNQSGLTFEVGLRALLRQDPDMIMVGETRDTQTASIAVRAAITGHLVFSTLHTNDAASAVVRLADMGVERYMIASALVGIVAQRLVRKICPVCGQWAPMTAEEAQFAGRALPRVMRAKGCSQCNNTGYRGRIAVHEMLPMNRRLREMIMEGASTVEIKDYAVKELGMKTLKTSTLELVEQGVTTIEELAKIACDDE